MADLDDKSISQGQTAAPTAEIPAAQAEKNLEQKTEPGKEKKRTFVSAGEKIHHWGTYLSIDWIFNATVGALFAYWGKFTPSGQKKWSQNIDKGFKALLKPLLKNPEHLKEGIKQGNTFMSIIAGGMFTIPPLLLLENTKVKKSIVKSIDGVVYGKDKVEHDPKFQQAYDEIQDAPKKDFWTGMTSRFAALAPLLALVLYPKTKDFLVKDLFSHVGNASKKVVAAVGLPAEKMFKKYTPVERAERWNYIHDDAVAMDLSFGLPYAVLHAFFYNMFAKMKGKKKHDNQSQGENNTTPVAQEPTAATGEVTQAQPARSFVGKISKDVGIVGRPAAISHDSFTDFANDTDKKLQVNSL